MRTLTGLGIAGVALGLFTAAPGAAEEIKATISAVTILNILAQPIEPRERAYDRVLREDGPPPASSPVGEVVGEGTVRYGRTTITVKNPCPPGTLHYEPPPLPGRRR